MTSDRAAEEAYVWIWLPDATEPVVAGKLRFSNGYYYFAYGRSYLARKNAIAVYDKDLPLSPSGSGGGINRFVALPRSVRDSAPDAWGRRVILNRLLGTRGVQADTEHLSELTYLLESGSDRIGALDFQRSPAEYVARQASGASLEELMDAARRVEEGLPLTQDLDQALHHGSSIGGARPKALLEGGDKKYIAKFPLASDAYDVIKAEFIAMRLAGLCGLSVAPVSLVKASGKDVLLIERFDRQKTAAGWLRKPLLSALTLLELDEMQARYASYEDLAEIIRHRFTEPGNTLRELFSRLVFNVLCGNTDDHARNHAAFWDGHALALTPAYDLCPQLRTGGEASQSMLIVGQDRSSRVAACMDGAKNFMLSTQESRRIVDAQINVIHENWDMLCEEAELAEVERNKLWHRSFLNPYAFE